MNTESKFITIEIVLNDGKYCNGCPCLDSYGQCNRFKKGLVVEGREGMPHDYNLRRDEYKVLRLGECK